MTIRIASRGRNAGGQFLGCTRYPNCRGVRPLPAANTPTAEPRDVWTVSRFNDAVREAVNVAFPSVWITGEISQCSQSGGHLFATIKDDTAQLEIIMWRAAFETLRFRPEIGLKVIMHGHASVYAPRGRLQLDIDQMLPEGQGELELAFKQLHARLSAEGLFDERRKRAMPKYPMRVGIITSADGAALRDILTILQRRAPHVEAVLAPVAVQGVTAANQIAAALDLFSRHGRVDLVIVGRGGGSPEDLQAFNEEVVIRAISR